ncbi:hypothetical protein Tco_0815323 [Tanacetum coccineum]
MAEQDSPPPTITAMKIPIIKKGEYDIWSMRMQQYICHTDHNPWDIIVDGDLQEEAALAGEQSSPPAPKTAKQLTAKRNQERVKSILLLAILDEYLLKFHNVPDAKSLWDAIKSRFGGNDESKKMQRNVLKHQFENFTTAPNESLDKAYDRFQKLISQLEVHAALVSREDIKYSETSRFSKLGLNCFWKVFPSLSSLSDIRAVRGYVCGVNPKAGICTTGGLRQCFATLLVWSGLFVPSWSEMEEDLAMLFGDDDFNDADSEEFEDGEEVWDVNEDWLMAPVTPPSVPAMPPPSTYEVGGPSTAAAEGQSFTLSALGFSMPPSVIEELSTSMGNLEYGHRHLVKKVIHVRDAEVADGITIREIGPRVSAVEGQIQVMVSQMVQVMGRLEQVDTQMEQGQQTAT